MKMNIQKSDAYFLASPCKPVSQFSHIVSTLVNSSVLALLINKQERILTTLVQFRPNYTKLQNGEAS